MRYSLWQVCHSADSALNPLLLVDIAINSIFTQFNIIRRFGLKYSNCTLASLSEHTYLNIHHFHYKIVYNLLTMTMGQI